jgi:hypothetical protein
VTAVGTEHWAFIHFTARLIGLIGVETDGRLALMRSFAGPLAAGTSCEHLSDRASGEPGGAGDQDRAGRLARVFLTPKRDLSYGNKRQH